MSNEINTASAYFNKHWQRYRSSVEHNTLYHREMLSALRQFLKVNMQGRAFSFVDVGCGDSSTIAPILADTSVKKYIGIDAAADVLKMAANSMMPLKCEKQFIADDMTNAINQLVSPVDIIYTSYAVHHLSATDKMSFIADCKRQLVPGGFLLMVDIVRRKNQTRDECLSALERRMQITIPNVTAEEITERMQHPRADDFPELIDNFEEVAHEQAWQDFKVLVDKGIFVFMVFAK